MCFTAPHGPYDLPYAWDHGALLGYRTEILFDIAEELPACFLADTSCRRSVASIAEQH